MSDWALGIAASLLILAAALAFVRLVRGPTLPDRVVALDLLALIIAGGMALYMIRTGLVVFLDALVILSLIAFFSTVAFARYLERRVSS